MEALLLTFQYFISSLLRKIYTRHINLEAKRIYRCFKKEKKKIKSTRRNQGNTPDQEQIDKFLELLGDPKLAHNKEVYTHFLDELVFGDSYNEESFRKECRSLIIEINKLIQKNQNRWFMLDEDIIILLDLKKEICRFSVYISSTRQQDD